MIKNLTIWSCAVGVGAAAATASPGIDRVAPANSLFVAGVDNLAESLERFKQTSMWALWESDEVQGMFSEAIEECREHLAELYEELDVEEGLLVPPKGPIGLAVFPGAPNQFEATTPGFLLMADFGANAFKFGRLFDAAIARIDEEGEPQFQTNELMGRTVYSFDLSDLNLDAVDLDGFDFDDIAPGLPVPHPMDVAEVIAKVHIVRDGTRFLAGSDLGALRDALEVIEGDDRPGLTDREDYQAARRQLGRTDAFAVMLTRDMVEAVAGDDPMAFMVQSMVQSVLGDIEAISVGVRMDGPNSMVEETFAVYMPDGPWGLTALLDTETPRRDVPSFVGPDAISYSCMNFEFGGIMDFLREVAQVNPMIGVQINQMLVEGGPMIEQITGALGPQVHVVAALSRPIDLSSFKSLYAVQSSRPDQVEAVLAQFAPGMGLEPRDFLGNRIYSLPFDPMMMGMGGPMMAAPAGDGFSIGFGAGYVMIGNTSMVEDALRTSGKAGVPTLADDPAYRRAVAALTAPRSVAWGVVNLMDYLAYFKDVSAMTQQHVIEQMKQWNPEYAQEMQDELDAAPSMPWEDLDIEHLKRFIGPIAWELRAREDGFVGKYFFLEPEQE